MSLKKERFIKGIILAPDTLSLDGIEGEIKVDSSTGKIQVTLKDGANPSASREIVTSSQTQSLTNKTLTSPVIDTGVSGTAIETDLAVSASATKLASASAIKTYVDNVASAQNEASEISYSNATSGLTATNVQNAIDEVDGNVDNLVTLSGVALDSTNLGTFTGVTIPDNSTVKSALQAIETSHESHTGASSGVHGVAGSVVGTSDSQALTNKTIDADLNTISNIENADIKVGANIARSKLASGTANRVVVNDATGVQTDAAAITAARVLISDANGIPTHSTVTSTSLSYLDATSSIQNQLDAKVDESGGTLTNGSVITPARLDVKQDTKANLTTYALTAANGQLCFATDTKEMFQIVDGLLESVGGGAGIGGVDILFSQTFEEAALTDFTQTGLSLSTSSPLHGEISALLTHQSLTNQSFKQIIPVDIKFRGQTMVLRLDSKSSASQGNVVINIYDETNSANLVASEQLQLSNDVNGKRTSVSFTIPETCASLSYTITALPEAGSPTTRIDDIICELAETALLETSVELTGDAQTITIPLTQSGLVQEGDGNLQINGFTPARATTNTAIISIVSGTATKNIGDHVVWTPSTTIGDTFTVTKSGMYSFSFSADMGTASDVGFSKNSTQLSTTFGSINNSDKLIASYDGGAAGISTMSWTGLLVVGDIIRIHITNVAFSGASALYSTFSCSYQGSLKQVSINPNSKITIPTSELRFEGASARGTTDTAIVRFDNIAKLRGDAFTVESDAVLGTRITMKKAGKLDVSTTLARSGTLFLAISKNQQNRTAFPLASESISSSGTNATSQLATTSASIFVSVGDIIRVSADAIPSSNTANSLNVSFQEQDISVSVTNTLPQFSESDSSVRVNTANGYGSTASNKIRRFSSVVENLGSDITYLDDSANGATFTIMSSGIYNITYTDQFSAQCLMGLSKNASSLTSAIQSLSASQILSVTNSVSTNQQESVSWQGYLSAGDIVRPHSEGTSAGTTTSAVNFTISKVGKPNVTGVDVTPFVNVPQPESQNIILSSSSGFGTTNTTVRRFTTIQDSSGQGIIKYEDSATLGASFIALKPCFVEFGYSEDGGITGQSIISVTKNSTSVLTNAINLGSVEPGAGRQGIAGSAYLNTGDVLRPVVEVPARHVTSSTIVRFSITAEASSDQILTAPETFSTDTASLTYAGSATYTLSTLANAPIGTFITYTFPGSSYIPTQTTTAPTQFASGYADANSNGIRLFAKSYSSPSTAASPARISLQIGKGMKGVTVNGYSATSKTTPFAIDTVATSSNSFGPCITYNELTGILDISVAEMILSTGTKFVGYDSLGGSAYSSGYFVINASKNPALTGVPALLPRIATLSDVKASGTEGGTATSGAYQTRTLNTISDPTGIVTSLTSNQFVLAAGEYYIEASAPTRAVNNNKIKIRNITDSTDAIIGSNAFAGTNGSSSVALGNIVITSSKTFELQHRVQTTTATNGFGSAAAFGESEVYSIVKITKVK